MKPFELVAMREAARTVERWRQMWGDADARKLVEMIVVETTNPEFRAAYLTAFGK